MALHLYDFSYKAPIPDRHASAAAKSRTRRFTLLLGSHAFTRCVRLPLHNKKDTPKGAAAVG